MDKEQLLNSINTNCSTLTTPPHHRGHANEDDHDANHQHNSNVRKRDIRMGNTTDQELDQRTSTDGRTVDLSSAK